MLGAGEEVWMCKEQVKLCGCVRDRRREVDEWGEGKETCLCQFDKGHVLVG